MCQKCQNKLKTLKDLEVAGQALAVKHNLTVLVSFCLGILKKIARRFKMRHNKHDCRSDSQGQTNSDPD